MGIKFNILVGSGGLAVLSSRYAPQYSLAGNLLLSWLLYFAFGFSVYEAWGFIIYPRFFSPFRDIPSITSKGHLIFDHTAEIIKNKTGEFQRQLIEEIPNDGFIRYSVWGQERLLPTNPKMLAEILVHQNYNFIKPTRTRETISRLLGEGILLAEGEEHKRQRKDLMPAFSYRHVKDLYPIFWKKSREMVELLRIASNPQNHNVSNEASFAEGEEHEHHAPRAVEVGEFASRATLDLIGLAGMGNDFNSLQNPNNKISHMYRAVFQSGRPGRLLTFLSLIFPISMLRRLPIQRNRQISEAASYIREVSRSLIAKKRATIADKGSTEIDIISVALSSGSFSDEDLVNQMMTFLAAGHETTSTALMWTMYGLAKNQDVQQKLRDEIRSKVPSLHSDIAAAELDSCDYLHAVCQEVLRLWSPVPLTIRVAAKDTSICGHYIPKGSLVFLVPYAINTSTHLWGADALEFKPERWLDANGKANNKGGADSNYSFMTFLHGPRSCIGQRFAEAELKCLVAAWVGSLSTKFENEAELHNEKPDRETSITSKPAGGVWVYLEELGSW